MTSTENFHKILDWGSFKEYSSPFLPKLWRIGTISDGSCFFHAVLTSLNKSYRDSSKNPREIAEIKKYKKIKDLRRDIAENINYKEWEKLQNGEPSYFQFLEKLRYLEKRINKVINNPSKYEKNNNRKWIFDIIGKDIEKEDINSVFNILRDILNKNNLFDINYLSKSKEKYSISNCINIFIKEEYNRFIKFLEPNIKKIVKKYNKELVEKSIINYKTLLSKCGELSKNLALISFKKHVEDTSEWVGTEYLEYLSDYFDTNIFIISSITGLPYITGDNPYKEGRKSIILLNINSMHYETLGYEIKLKNGKSKLKCKIPWSNKLIQKIYILTDKNKTRIKFPEIYKKIYQDEMVVSGDETDSEYYNSDDEKINKILNK